ncbi:hypothetical protein NliqN6_4224 [Naganishia liquefaciens]|uniref:Transmembrane protein n=1 Tax=Naganishia liquefaciens TaxID=104408 RepID=A0A8H3YH35_9TREE|nr:hypothetical protein NliqN6_4224 [Naganishia liquefaciens]
MSLRRTFTAKDEDGQETPVQRLALDEDEQEELIQGLVRRNQEETSFNLLALDGLICLSFSMYLFRLMSSLCKGGNLSLPYGRVALAFMVLLHPVLVSFTRIKFLLCFSRNTGRLSDPRDIVPLRSLLIPTFAPMTASFFQGQRLHEVLFWGFPFLLLLLVILFREEEAATEARLERLRGLKYHLKGA